MAVQIATTRGPYNLRAAAPLENEGGAVVLTLAMERADGIERVVVRCHIAASFAGLPVDADALIARMRPWLERQFEQTREAALKSIRAERRLLELRFDADNPGPFG
ncbi:MAG TPA: hypothetical protein VJ718_06330 [Candidatus Binataceae bacterium]|nr:hypothetical protein [Candidatus Binataceae bacterium]